MRGREARALAGAVLILAGAAALAAAIAGYLQAPVWQSVHAEEVLQSQGLAAPASGPAPGMPLARLRIPRMDLDVVVIEGTRPADLLKAPGHLTGSALPGEPENCIIAGHRDLHFSRLAELRPGDRVELAAEGRTFSYRVEASRVVAPSETSVLAPGNQSLLTLITCYPFHYVGPAPRRYVVVARLAGAPRPTSQRKSSG